MESLVLFSQFFLDPVGEAFVRLLKWLFKDGEMEASKGQKRYGQLWREVMEAPKTPGSVIVGNDLQDYWLERLLEDPNPFHRKAELVPLPQISFSLQKAYQRELAVFRSILKTDWEGEVKKALGSVKGSALPSLEENAQLEASKTTPARAGMKKKILSDRINDTQLVSEIGNYFYQNGFGLFGSSRAFRWANSPEGLGNLEGIQAIDPVRLENLVGYDEIRQPLIENIEGFVAGKPANNVLLYGERGTGKSSHVKALLNAYGDKGLRVVEVHPDQLKDYPEILKPLRGRRERFILFVDDLSFEENETSYKGLKALLEGTVEATPSNVILIATSNRRHLIKEFFAERVGGIHQDGEVHGQDTVEEKLSLSDRFGLVVSFYTPDQDTYLKIVESWAKHEGIRMPAQELHVRALRWEKSNNVRSGRTARQFINDLKGKF